MIVCEIKNISASNTEKLIYNSSDLTYLSNGIQFPISDSVVRTLQREDTTDNISQIQWFTGLYDHHKWLNNLLDMDVPECKYDMIRYLNELRNGTSWAIKSEYSGNFHFISVTLHIRYGETICFRNTVNLFSYFFLLSGISMILLNNSIQKKYYLKQTCNHTNLISQLITKMHLCGVKHYVNKSQVKSKLEAYSW